MAFNLNAAKGYNQEIWIGGNHLNPVTWRKAALAVCGRSRDSQEAVEFLGALGLIETTKVTKTKIRRPKTDLAEWMYK